MQTFVMEGNEKKADESVEGEAELDGGPKAAAKAPTTEHSRKETDAPAEFAAHPHAQAETGKTDELVPKAKVSWQFLQKERKGRTHRSHKVR